jgi:hypothetical protein
MKRWILPALFLSTAALLTSVLPSISAQSPEVVWVAPDGGTVNHIDGIFIPQVANAPFTAKEPVERAHTLEDGTVVNRKYYTIIARDSQGRVHRESRRGVPSNSNREPRLNYTFVLDPPAGTRTECYPAARICRVLSYSLVTVRITELDLGEPDPKLFEIPEGCKVVDERKQAE